MRKKESFILTFFLFLILSIVLFFFGKTPFVSSFGGVLERVLLPFQNITKNVADIPSALFRNNEVEKIKAENQRLTKKLVDQKTLDKENQALKDQFTTSPVNNLDLMPANIIGMPGFVPGTNNPAYITINKGEGDGVVVNKAVVFKDNLVGKVVKTSKYTAKIYLLTHASSSFTAKTLETNALGVIKGNGGDEMIFENVLLSERLIEKNIVLTSGEFDDENKGYPPNIVVGEIITIDKKPSALFQSARIKSKLDFSKLTTVFIVMGYKK